MISSDVVLRSVTYQSSYMYSCLHTTLQGCMPVNKDRWPKHRPYSGNSPAEIVELDFPIKMHSKLRWSPIVYTQGEDGVLVHKQHSFSEVVVLNVVKKHF